jgi:hypothetical protein
MAPSEPIQLVKMRRDVPPIPNGPTTGDFHPDTVQEMLDNGWVLDEQEIKSSGPTFEQWVAAGYLPEAYPPDGYDEIPSQGLDEFRALQAAMAATEPQRDGVVTGDQATEQAETPAPPPAEARPSRRRQQN